MSTPDRFQKLVQSKQTIWLSGHVSNNITAADAVALLRRQHARVVRMVKQLRGKRTLVSLEGALASVAYNHACDDILAKLAQIKKGTP